MSTMFSFDAIKAIIFDLDDTLVRTQLDFAYIKEKIGCPHNDDVLTFIEQIPCQQAQQRAHDIVLEHELLDAQCSAWLPGAKAFVDMAAHHLLPLAIVTRNCKQATALKLANNNIPIKLVLTREDAPAKPDPTALLQIAEQWQIEPAEIAYIGDYKYDIEAAHNASMQAWLYQPCGDDNKPYAQKLQFVPNQA